MLIAGAAGRRGMGGGEGRLDSSPCVQEHAGRGRGVSGRQDWPRTSQGEEENSEK